MILRTASTDTQTHAPFPFSLSLVCIVGSALETFKRRFYDDESMSVCLGALALLQLDDNSAAAAAAAACDTQLFTFRPLGLFCSLPLFFFESSGTLENGFLGAARDLGCSNSRTALCMWAILQMGCRKDLAFTHL